MARIARCEECERTQPLDVYGMLPTGWITLHRRGDSFMMPDYCGVACCLASLQRMAGTSVPPAAPIVEAPVELPPAPIALVVPPSMELRSPLGLPPPDDMLRVSGHTFDCNQWHADTGGFYYDGLRGCTCHGWQEPPAATPPAAAPAAIAQDEAPL